MPIVDGLPCALQPYEPMPIFIGIGVALILLIGLIVVAYRKGKHLSKKLDDDNKTSRS